MGVPACAGHITSCVLVSLEATGGLEPRGRRHLVNSDLSPQAEGDLSHGACVNPESCRFHFLSKYEDPRLCARHPEVQGKASQPPCDHLLPAGTPVASPRSLALRSSRLPAPSASEKRRAPASPRFRPLLQPLDSQGSCVGVCSRKSALGATHVST